ncbi:MAG: hypothetical protein HON44_08915 [Glaciecola sp.]|nr:hypothetical protein [Glaciecola sp.]
MMKDLNSDQLIQVSGGDMTAEHGIAGALGGGLGGAGLAGVYIGLATNPAGWVILSIIGTGAAIGSAYMLLND